VTRRRAGKSRKFSKRDRQVQFAGRSFFTLGLMALGAFILLGRAVHLQVIDQDFLNNQADARQLRNIELSAHRGTISDRNGEALAVSTPVDSIWVDPGDLLKAPDKIPLLARLLNRNADELKAKISRSAGKNFLYLNRRMKPVSAQRVQDAGIPGVHLQREYRRYYPAGQVTGHLIGFTDIDDIGQEGIELAFDHRLAGSPGKVLIIKDRLGRIVDVVERKEAAEPGQDIATSIDLRIQYLAYRELQKTVQAHKARSGSAVVVDVLTGEVLALVNQPTYNPNDGKQKEPARYRNRAITDIFEPGSSLKPFVIAAALESGSYRAETLIDTNPGFLQVGPKKIEDNENLGRIDLGTVLARSSNVGASKIAMSLDPEQLWAVLDEFGLGHPTASGFPGESAGLLSHFGNWRPISQATLAYGYGLSVTPLQLAQAYAVLGSGGLLRPVSLLRLNEPQFPRRIISAASADAVLGFMEEVVAPDGTGYRAAVPGYRIAGKTGTTQKFTAGGYSEDRYTAIFAGLAPASNPRLAVVVVIDEPNNGEYYGGKVAAPVFSNIVAGAARILAIPPDDLRERQGSLTVASRD